MHIKYFAHDKASVNWSRRLLSDYFLPKKNLKNSSIWSESKIKMNYHLKHYCGGTSCFSSEGRAVWILEGMRISLLIYVAPRLEII